MFKEEQGMRNQVEGKLGQGKNGYNLCRIRNIGKDLYKPVWSADRLDCSHILCDELDKVQQRIFAFIFKDRFCFSFSGANYLCSATTAKYGI